MVRMAVALVMTAAWSCAAAAAERPVDSRITSVGLFKNGLAVVHRIAKIPGPGTYRVDDVPEPVHGTFWVESDVKLVTRLTRRTVEVPARRSAGIDFQEELAGKEVVVHFTTPDVPPATGRVARLEPPRGDEAWSRSYEQPRWRYSAYSSGPQPYPSGRMLVLETESGRAYVDTSHIAYLQAKDAGPTVQQLKPVLLFTVDETKDKPATIRISYLAKGMAWAPSYRIDISDAETLRLRQKAVIKNELEDMENAEIRLISGYPSVQFAHVTSPLSLQTTWAQFFAQLNQQPGSGHVALSNAAFQQVVQFNAPAPGQGLDLSAVPSGEGVDLHYQLVGKHTLDEGDSVALEVAEGSAPYQRIVEWIVPDTRHANGQYVSEHERQSNPDKYRDAAWDAVRFKNPLSFPMTTGPAMIVADGRFNGQCLSYWVNSGEETTLHVTKALSIRTMAVENEVEDNRDFVYIGGLRYRQTLVEGKLRANNHRNEAVELVIRRRFSGELVKADQSPKCTLLEEGVYSVNKRNQLTWTITLEPGKEVELNYRYTVLVRH